MIGSTRLARRAGIHTARSATARQDERDADEHQRIARLDAERGKLAMKRASPNADASPTTTPTSASAMPWKHHHVLHLAGLRAERQADADLLRALLDRVRHQPVDADRREQQRGAAEHRHQPHVEPLARGRRATRPRSSTARPRPAGRSPAAAAPGSRRSREAARPCVRTTHAIGVRSTFSAFAASGTCACGMYIIGPGSLFRPPSRTSPTTPMICRSRLVGELAHDAAADDQPIVQRIALLARTAAPSPR